MEVSRYNYAHQFGDAIECLMGDLQRMLVDGRYVLTEEVRRFEREFAAYLGAECVLGVNTGTDALTIALVALGIGRGDRVVTQANTFNATVSAIRLSGATPELVDADDATYLIDREQAAAAIGSQVRAIVPVHLYGKPTPLTTLIALADRHGVFVLEDAAQAHGARIHGRRVGSLGTAGCFSFHPSKNLAAAGDAGAIATRDRALAARIAEHRNLGQRTQNDHVITGANSKLDALQARILSWKLPHLDEWNRRRQRVARLYREGLEGVPLAFQEWSPGEAHVFHLFTVRTDRRDALIAHLQAAGVDAVVRYPAPIHLQPAFADLGWRRGQFPVAERLARELLCLPIRPDMPLTEIEFVVDAVRGFFGQ